MRRLILLCLLLISFIGYGQHTIKGTLKPEGDHKWMIVYKLNGSKQDFVTYDSIKNGTFHLTISKERKPGMYRLFYDMQKQLYLDVFYDQEDIEFSFNPINPLNSVQFSASKNNRLYTDYVQKTTIVQQVLDSLQMVYFTADNTEKEKIQTTYAEELNRLAGLQQDFEIQSENLLVHDFIASNKKYYNTSLFETPVAYQIAMNAHFYDPIDFNNKTLSNTTFLHNKINEYIFRLNSSDDPAILKALRKKAIDATIEKINSNKALLQDIEEGLLYNFSQAQDVEMTNFMLSRYLELPKEYQDLGFVNDIKGQLRTAVGNLAPDIFWGTNNEKTLHQLKGSPYYLVLFWSSGCGHCLKELPLLADYLKDKPNIKVVAVGLETEESKPTWKKIITKHPNWLHVYGKDKWKNQYATAYGVASTPSFYLLDSKKVILAKPDDTRGLEAFVNNL